jgi:hypothetical protein
MESHAYVFIVSHPHLAKYKVFFIDNEYLQRNAQLIQGGTLVEYEHLATVKVCIVKHMSQADILITEANFPKQGEHKQPPAWR